MFIVLDLHRFWWRSKRIKCNDVLVHVRIDIVIINSFAVDNVVERMKDDFISVDIVVKINFLDLQLDKRIGVDWKV